MGNNIGNKVIPGLAIVAALVVALIIAFFIFTKAVVPDAGHEAVLVEKPMMFGHGGINPSPVRAGRTYVMWTTQVVDVNMQPMQEVIHFNDLMSSDGVPLDFDVAIRLQVKESVPLIEVFGPNWYENNLKAEVANRVRQEVRKYGMNETAISTDAVDKIDRNVTLEVSTYLESAKLPIKLIQVTVGKANPPDSIKDQRIETAAQQQRALAEAQRKLAEDARKFAEQSRANADNAYRNMMQLSPNQFLSLEAIKMQEKVCGDGKSHCTFIVGAGSVAPIIATKQ